MAPSRDRDSRIFVGNLPRDIRSREVESLFYKYGRIRDVNVRSSRSRGPAFAFVEFDDPRDADDAVHARDGYDYGGSKIRVEFCNGGRGSPERSRNGRNSRQNAPPRRSSYRLYVSNLPSSGSWQDLKDHMRQAGDVLFADVYKDGTAVVEFGRREDLKYALDNLQGSTFRSHENETTVVTLKNGMRSPSERSRSGSSRSRRSHSRERTRSFSREKSPRKRSVSKDSRRSYSKSSRSASKESNRRSFSRDSSKHSSVEKKRSRTASMEEK